MRNVEHSFVLYALLLEPGGCLRLTLHSLNLLSLGKKKTEECDWHWILVATLDPRLPSCIPIALRQDCNVVVGEFGPPDNVQQDFAVTLTARIEDADSVAPVL